MKGIGGVDDIYYVALINKVLWDQGVYHVFDRIDEDSKNIIIVKGSVVAKQLKFRNQTKSYEGGDGRNTEEGIN